MRKVNLAERDTEYRVRGGRYVPAEDGPVARPAVRNSSVDRESLDAGRCGGGQRRGCAGPLPRVHQGLRVLEGKREHLRERSCRC